MRIAFVGSHGTGKSTLADEIQYNTMGGQDWSIKESVARPFRSLIKRLNLDDNNSQLLINELSFWNWESNVDIQNLVFTRTPIDNVAYTMVNANDEFSKSLAVEYHSKLKKLSWGDTIFMYLPIEFPLVNDGVRPMDPAYQEAVDKQMRLLLEELQINYYVIKGPVDERISSIDGILKLRMGK
jgi:predicted ATPase